MADFAPGGTFVCPFTISSSTGALANADSLPTGSMYHQGTLDLSFSITVTNVATGVYFATGVVPIGYTPNTYISLIVDATVGGVAAGNAYGPFRVSIDSASIATTLAAVGYFPPAIAFTVNDATPTQTQFHISVTGESAPTDLTGTFLIFTSSSTVTLGLGYEITAYTPSTLYATVAQLPAAPENGDSGVIVGRVGM